MVAAEHVRVRRLSTGDRARVCELLLRGLQGIAHRRLGVEQELAIPSW